MEEDHGDDHEELERGKVRSEYKENEVTLVVSKGAKMTIIPKQTVMGFLVVLTMPTWTCFAVAEVGKYAQYISTV